MNGIQAYQNHKKNSNMTMLQLFIGVFVRLLEEMHLLKDCVDQKNIEKREEHFANIHDILIRFSQGFREENHEEWEWGEILLPLLVHVREEARRIRRYDTTGYTEFVTLFEGLIAFWKEQDALWKQKIAETQVTIEPQVQSVPTPDPGT